MPENRVELPLISVIVPVYRAEKYIERCVKSLAAQTYKNIEFILVFDGDKESYVRCRNITGKDARFRLIMQEHGGVWKARNAGLEEVKGEFIGFVDSDDYIEPDMYEYLLKAALKTGADVVEGGGGDERHPVQAVSNYVWDKLYKKEICKGLYFRDFETGQDLYFNMEVLSRTKKIRFVPAGKYIYSLNPKGISKTVDAKTRLKVSQNMRKMATLQFGRSSDIYKRILKEMLLNYIDSLSHIVKGESYAENFVIRKMQKELTDNKKFIIFCSDLKLIHKIKCLVAGKNMTVYSLMIRCGNSFLKHFEYGAATII